VQLEPIEWVDPLTTSRPHGPQCLQAVEVPRCLLAQAAPLRLRRPRRTVAA
jgi:hypothetical protein